MKKRALEEIRFQKSIRDAQQKYVFKQNNSTNTIRNHAVPHGVIVFWYTIIDYANAVGDICGEGNSGEFHDESEAFSFEHKGAHALKVLAIEFAKNTGWKPVWVKVEEEKQWVADKKIGVDTYSGKEWFDGYWKFEYVRPWRTHEASNRS
jgi:hypothetical protein